MNYFRRSPKPSKEQGKPVVVEAENDFPIARVTSVVVGSAHAATNDPDVEAALLALFTKLVERCAADTPGPAPIIEYKS